MTGDGEIAANLVLRRAGESSIGADRIALLQAIAELGSITAAAARLGLSYKGAWSVVQALNNLFERPLVLKQAGGASGGGAVVTPAGRAVIAAHRAIEADLARALQRLEKTLGQEGEGIGRSVLWSLGMKTSAENTLYGKIGRLTEGAVNSEVVLDLGDGIDIVAIVTRQSVKDLQLVVGRDALAMFNAGSVILALGQAPIATSARNALLGSVIDVHSGAVNDEVTIELSPGKTLVATVTHESARRLNLQPGDRVQALIKASHVIIAVV